jgi:hypothetical protein
MGLGVLAGLPLLHLELSQTRGQLAAIPTANEVAALTASSQLTCLVIDQGLVTQYPQLFPRGRRLPYLKELRATMGLLGVGHEECAYTVVRCCPSLERLDVGTGAHAFPSVLNDLGLHGGFHPFMRWWVAW